MCSPNEAELKRGQCSRDMQSDFQITCVCIMHTFTDTQRWSKEWYCSCISFWSTGLGEKCSFVVLNLKCVLLDTVVWTHELILQSYVTEAKLEGL